MSDSTADTESEIRRPGPMRGLWRVVHQHWRAFLALNLLYYGLSAGAALWVAHDPGFEQALRGAVKSAMDPALMGAYASGAVLSAVLLTFVNNFMLASVLVLTVPSLVVPFWGLGVGAVRAVLWGLALSPADPTYRVRMLANVPTGLLEGEGYVLAMLGAFLLWRNVLWPRRAGVASARAGYLLGVRQTALLYAGVFILLLLGAIYEALVAIYLVPRLT